MKKLFILAIPLTVLFLCCITCIGLFVFGYYQGRGSGNVVTESRTIGSFTEIELNGQGILIIEQGDEYSLEIEAEDNILERMTTEIEGEKLTIGYKKQFPYIFSNTIFPREDINIYLTVKDLEEVRLNGGGLIKASYLNLDHLIITINGAGDTEIEELYANKLTINLTGAGDLSIEGEVDVQKVTITGTGNYNALDLLSKDCEIDLSGVGDAEVYVTQDLDINISGIGDVKYDGSPDTIEQNISGIGRIEEL